MLVTLASKVRKKRAMFVTLVSKFERSAQYAAVSCRRLDLPVRLPRM